VPHRHSCCRPTRKSSTPPGAAGSPRTPSAPPPPWPPSRPHHSRKLKPRIQHRGAEEAKINGRIPTETTPGNRSNETTPYESSGSQIERPEGVELGDSGRRIDRRRGEMARREGGKEAGLETLGGVHKRASFPLPPSTVRLRLGVGRVEGERGCFQKTSPVEGQRKRTRNTRINY
jgi:hypothetical protein